MTDTALDILKKHFEEAKRNHPEENWVDDIVKHPIESGLVLAAMREIYELGDREGYKRRDDELERTTTEIDLDDRMKQLFPEK